MKIAVCTTFPIEQFSICAEEMLQSFKAYWPEDIKMYVQLDEMHPEAFKDINNKIMTILGEDRCFIAGKFEDEQKSFIEAWKEHKPKSYLDDAVKFSHKVFALEKCADAIKDSHDYLIWLDADVITKNPVDHEWLKTVLPADDEVVSYLARKGLHSECGWVAYNLKASGYELLKSMKDEYLSGRIATEYSRGLTDCHVIDKCVGIYKFKDLCPEYEYGKSDINVWAESKLAEKMAHRKGNRKYKAANNRGRQSNVVDVNDMKVKTRNCVDHGKIKGNVSTNLSQIRAWSSLCRPTMQESTPDPIIICAAGPSLINHIDEIKALQAKGGKVVAVKHAINTLKEHGVKPWGVVLLDPRAHVEEFIQNPDPDVVYFVASMCDPSVVKTLNDNRCRVIGYHAFVNAGEMELMISSDLPVSGGSATSTRSIGLFSDMFGYKDFHLFGYDLCHYQKPDMEEKSVDGQKKYMEITIGTNSHKNKYITRTFWTEGQFIAQSNEIVNLCKERKDINLTIYGNGMAGWLYRHWNLNKDYMRAYNESLERKRVGTPTLQEFINAVTRGADLSRGA